MGKEELLSMGMQQVIQKFELEQGRRISDKDKILFLEGFNYACLLLSKNS